MSGPPLAPPPTLEPRPPAHLHPHAVPWQHALSWFEDALRLFKRRTGTWILLTVLTLATELALQVLPPPWPLLSKIVSPLVACGLLFAAAAADRHAAPRVAYAIAAFRAPAGAIVAIVLASLAAYGSEVFAAWWIADVNLLTLQGADADLTMAAWIGVYAIGVLASLPVAFVPLHVLFEPVDIRAAFVASWQAFVQNTGPLLVYAGLSLVLLGFGLATYGLGLLLAMPIWAASSYAAWRDIFGIGAAPDID